MKFREIDGNGGQLPQNCTFTSKKRKTSHRHLEVVWRRTARGAFLPGIVCHNFTCVEGGGPSDVSSAMAMALSFRKICSA